MKKTEILAYTAGIVDGEGSIFISKIHKGTRLSVTVTNTNEWLIHWLKFNYGGDIYQKDRIPDPRYIKKRKTCWTWSLRYKKASQFLEIILPYLYLKKPQAELAIQFSKNKQPFGVRRYPLTEEEKAVVEAQRLLMRKYNQGIPANPSRLFGINRRDK